MAARGPDNLIYGKVRRGRGGAVTLRISHGEESTPMYSQQEGDGRKCKSLLIWAQYLAKRQWFNAYVTALTLYDVRAKIFFAKNLKLFPIVGIFSQVTLNLFSMYI